MKNKDFTQIPNRILKSKALLNHTEFRLYCVLQSFDYQKGFVYPGRERLAKEMGVSVSTVDRAKKGLEAKGAFKKKRRGQGKTNIYYINQNFLFEPDESQVIEPESSSLIRKEEKDNNTKFNNYLSKSSTYKEKDLGGKSQPSSETQTKNKNSEMVFRSQLNKIKKSVDIYLNTLTDEEIEEEEWPQDTKAPISAIIYYLRKYKNTCGIYHPRYVSSQTIDCYMSFISGVYYLEKTPISVEEVFVKAIDHWFLTTSKDFNNLRLSHFAGNGSKVIFNSVEAVMNSEYGLYWREDGSW